MSKVSFAAAVCVWMGVFGARARAEGEFPLEWQPAEIALQEGTAVRLADKEEAAGILGAEDEFIRSMSPFDRSARMETDREVSKKEFLEFVALQALSFSDAESGKLRTVFASIDTKLQALGLRLTLPAAVTIIKTTGREEGGASYCRGTAIVLPRNVISGTAKRLEDIIIHELFHILTRTNPDLRRELYAIVGFVPCTEIALPEELLPRKITNPDAFRNDFCVEVGFRDRRIHVIPILLSRSERYDVARGGAFFAYMTLRLLAVEEHEGRWVPSLTDGQPLLIDVSEAPEYAQRLGRNTRYIIHPEEVLADNFRLMVNQARNVRSPEILVAMRELLSPSAIALPRQPSTTSPGRT